MTTKMKLLVENVLKLDVHTPQNEAMACEKCSVTIQLQNRMTKYLPV